MDRGAPTVNHTRNIQGNDIERLPYPWWVSESRKRQAATITRRAVHQLQAGELIETDTIAAELDMESGLSSGGCWRRQMKTLVAAPPGLTAARPAAG